MVFSDLLAPRGRTPQIAGTAQSLPAHLPALLSHITQRAAHPGAEIPAGGCSERGVGAAVASLDIGESERVEAIEIDGFELLPRRPGEMTGGVDDAGYRLCADARPVNNKPAARLAFVLVAVINPGAAVGAGVKWVVS